jgi:2-polyprenyl-3-methyl-5-hydroxy-6-metoxy-1,4-benzoquinol methylase
MIFFPRDLAAPLAAPGPAIEWEETDCLLCGGRRWSSLVEAPDTTTGGTGLWFAVVQCEDCGLCFTNPRPSPGAIEQFYPEVYRPHHAPHPRRRSRWRLRLPAAWRHRGKEYHMLAWHGQGRLLDFGCGCGVFLEQMHRQGWQVTGVDISAAAVRRIRSELGLHAVVGSLPHPELQPGSLDVITMWHSLEHVHAPLTVLRDAYRLLVPGGLLLVAVPNVDSLPFRWFGQAWYGLDLPRHLTHFAPWTLQLMLERAGFRVGPIRMVRHSDWLRWSAKRACQRPEAPCWFHWLTAKPASRLISWYTYLTRQADCLLVTATR